MKGKVRLGITFEVQPEKKPVRFKGAPNLKTEISGLVVRDVAANGPAKKHDIQPGDWVYLIDATGLDNVSKIYDALRNKSPGDTVTLYLRREGTPLIRIVVLEQGPKIPNASARGKGP